MNTKILCFFPFLFLVIMYVADIIPFTIIHGIIFVSFWIVCLTFDLYSTFQRKELLQYETNCIILHLLKTTTHAKTIFLFVIFETACLIGFTVISLWNFDFVYCSIISVLLGSLHCMAGLSNRKIITQFDNMIN